MSNHDDTYESVPLRPVGEITGPLVPIRDDTTFAFSEPYPLHGAFEMPPPRASRPSFVSATIAAAVVAAHQQGNSTAFALALEQLADALDGGANRNSGNVAPIQGQG
jgi:hypothetical protein